MRSTQRQPRTRVTTRGAKPTPIEIRRILCPVDFSEFSQRALAYAGATAKWYGSELTVMHALPDVPVADMIPSLAIEAAQRVSPRNIDRKDLTQATQRFAQDVVPPGVRVHILLHDAPDVHREILSQAKAVKADLLVIGSHGRSGFERFVLGSVTEKVLQKAECPVMVIPRLASHAVAPGAVAFDHIVCAIDFSDSSVRALSYALSLAEESDAHLKVMHVLEIPPELDDTLIPKLDLETVRLSARADATERLQALIPKSAHTYCQLEITVVAGNPYKEILRLASAQKSDLIVMGTHGGGAMDQMLFGSNTHHVIRSAECPVLAVRAR